MENHRSVEQVLEKIKTEHLAVRPKWEFGLENILWWLLFISFGFGGALFLIFITNALSGGDWDLGPRHQIGYFRLFFLLVPPSWLVFLAAAAALAFLFFRSTRYGYRYGMKSAATIVLGTIVLAGILSFLTKADRFIGQRLPQPIPGYGQMAAVREEMWSHPERGLLAGEIISANDAAREAVLLDFRGEEWELSFVPDVRIPKLLQGPLGGKRVKAIGAVTGESSFLVQELRPWHDWMERPMMRGPMGPMMRSR